MLILSHGLLALLQSKSLPAIIDRVLSELGEQPVWNELDDEINQKGRGADCERDAPLRSVKSFRIARENTTSQLGNEDLATNNHEEKDDEGYVCGYVGEDVDLIVHLSAANQVHDLHQNKRGEDKCEVTR